MHEVLKAFSPRMEVTALPGDVDNLLNQGQLPGLSHAVAFIPGEDLVCICAPDNL